ncbi:hypothetical protein K503DRAFT_504578 [Rhizopogon vinicolor AM-OR11-026]|uniref:Uncharacterized protein n=1 Tax=Rhizopogon vinicolor AM-OR11-026 TaxID=1314800 RepID=A0A1B7MM68_9AGAM|nr:hypothetical protein K503DRAFT_504578 [Rhizopogon vinicolor AM-OR11-026]
MSNTAMPEALIAAPTTYCPTLMTINLHSPSRRSGDIENQHQFPSPSSTGINGRLHLLFLATMSWYGLGHIHVEEFLRDVEMNWEKHNARFREAIGQITTAQGLVLGVCATFLTSSPPVPSVDYTSSDCYSMFAVAFLLSIGGLVFQLLFFQASQALSQEPKPQPAAIHDYIELFCLPQYSLLSSLIFLGIGFLRALMASGPISYFELAVPVILVLIAAIFTKVERGTITLTRRIADIILISMIVMICTVGYKSTWWTIAVAQPA